MAESKDAISALKHTPGPWRVETNYPRAPKFRVVKDVEWTSVPQTVVEVGDENLAHLIAAAPDMYAVLQMLQNDRRIALGMTHRKRIDAALPKATLKSGG